MEFSVQLAKLPDRVIFPERLRDKVTYREADGKLFFRGFMTKCTYDELSALSDDIEYHRALEALFVLSATEIAPRPATRGLVSAMLVGTLGLVALLAAVYWFGLRRSATDNGATSDSSVAASAAAR
jgi:hypothetical protein